MRLRHLSALSMFAAFAVSVEVGACASPGEDGSPPTTNSNEHLSRDATADEGVIPSDASIDGGDTDPPCVPEAFCPLSLFGLSDTNPMFDIRTRINVIRGRSPSDVWAAGSMGAMAHFDGKAWKRSETAAGGPVSGIESIRGLWLRETGEMAWASVFPASTWVRGIDLVPSAGAHPSADGWLAAEDVTVPDTVAKGLTAVWGMPDAEWVWGTSATSINDPTTRTNGLWRARIDADAGTLEVRDPLPSGACNTLYGCWSMQALHGATADDLWAVGGGGVALHITGAQSDAPTFTAIDSLTRLSLNGVWATGSEMFAVGAGGTIRHYSGTGDSLEVVTDVPAVEALRAVWGTSANDVWAVGDAACVLHWDGTHWSRIAVGGIEGDHRRPNLYTVWTGTPGKVWIGGDGVLLTLGGHP